MMARNKGRSLTPRGSRGGRGRGGGRAGYQSRGRDTALAPPQLSFIGATGFTLADEARQTSQHDHSSLLNLRSRPVAFVSAGTIEPLKLLDELLGENQKLLEADLEVVEHESEGDVPPQEEAPDATLEAAHRTYGDNDDDQQDDIPAQDNEDESTEEKLIGPEELEMSIQSQPIFQEEPSFFLDVNGNKTQTYIPKEPVHIPERSLSRGSSSSEEVILFKGRDSRRQIKPEPEISLVQMHTEINVMEREIRNLPNTISSPSQEGQATKDKRQHRKKKSTVTEEEDAIIADYIANMRENGEFLETSTFQSSHRRELGGTDGEIDYGSDDVHDQNMLAKDIRATDHEDQDVGPDSAHSSGSHSEQPPQAGHRTKSDVDGLSESEIDDATLAKLITGNELEADDDDVNFGDSSNESELPGSPKKKVTQKPVVDNFDVMDWDRPSLRRKKGKGAKAQININHSDSETERLLQAAWKGDRLKKSERKKQREELRALGMLGKKSNPDDLQIKYPSGMKLEDVAEEVKTFLLSSDDALVLPPMDNHARKMVHELANKLHIKSKSTGKANQRRPTLYRTGRTLPFVAATFDQAFSRIGRRYFPRSDLKGKRSQQPQPKRSGHAEASYRDGEIVGATAPELASDNRGRAMLEKMGWSSGTALGATNNKGILQPVTQTMKRSKAGLG